MTAIGVHESFAMSDVKDITVGESTKLFLVNGFRGTSVKQIRGDVPIQRPVVVFDIELRYIFFSLLYAPALFMAL